MDSLEMEQHVTMSMNVQMEPIHVHYKLNVQTLKDPTVVCVVMDTEAMEQHVTTSVNVLKEHTTVWM